MLFQTPSFGLFLVLVVIVATLLDRHPKAHQSFLLAASYFFYGAWDWKLLGLILFSTVLDYAVGLGIQRSDSRVRRKWLLATSLVGNLGMLCLFKYYDFFAENLSQMFAWAGLSVSVPTLHLILPVGISFYTFQTLSYTIDIYRGKLEARKSLIQVALFVAFFPQLIAGPIVRARQFLPQLDRRPRYNRETSGSGLYLILKGLVKKIVVADVLGMYLVDPVFHDPTHYGGVWILLANYAFLFQIYCDFSGYSDVAIGVGRLLGYELPINFRSPYKAHSFSDFWQRWHITLSLWFRDYLFVPLAAGHGAIRVSVSLLFTMFLVGLWHGAAWTFVLWGVIHGVYLVIERTWRHLYGRRRKPQGWRRVIKILLVFHLYIIPTAIFRSTNMVTFGAMATSLFKSAADLKLPMAVWLVFLLTVFTHYLPEAWKGRAETAFVRMPAVFQAAALVGCLLLFRVTSTTTSPFFYFQF
jgi:alginate O-acetyltransferase complex protein AlgI